MKNVIILILCFFVYIVPVNSCEIVQPKAVQTFNYVLPEDEPDIHKTDDEDNFPMPSEVELKGTVIYDEGKNSLPVIELELEPEMSEPKIRLKTANMVISSNDTKVYTTTGFYTQARSAISTASRLTGEEYVIAPVCSYIREEVGNFSYGTSYSAGIDSSQLQTSMNIYTRYDFKYFAITGGIGTTERNIEYSADDSIVHIAPEIKLSKSFTIRDTVQAYTNRDVKKNKISIIYTPMRQKNPDTVRLELGITNSYYTGGKINSSVEFSTKIKL